MSVGSTIVPPGSSIQACSKEPRKPSTNWDGETLDRPEAAGPTHLRSAIESFKETGVQLRLPYYLALLADAHLRADEVDAGLHIVEEALSRGRERTSAGGTLELRAAQALAGLWAGSGWTAEARELLAPVYSWFTEGLETPDLANARALLSSLG